MPIENLGAAWTPDGMGGGWFEFDGSGGYLRAQLDVNPWFVRYPVCTMGARVRVDRLDSSAHMILSANDGNYDRTLAIDQRADGQVYRWSPYRGGAPSVACPPAEAGSEWVLFVAVYDGTRGVDGEVRFYVDGVETILPGDPGPSHPFLDIGRNPSNSSHHFVGAIDDVFVFEGALSAVQVEDIRVGGVGAILSTMPDNSKRERFEHDGYCPDPEPGDILLGPAVIDGVDPAAWRYTTVDPGPGWSDEVFEPDASWAVGPPGFGRVGDRHERDVYTTDWQGDRLWLRTSVTLTANDLESENGAPLAFWGRWDNYLELWVNGVPATIRVDGMDPGARRTVLYRYLGTTAEGAAAWKEGENTIAALVHNTGGDGYFDLALVSNPFDGMPVDGFHSNSRTAGFLDPIRRWAARSCVPTTAFAVMQDGVVRANYAIGYMDKQRSVPAPRDAMLRTASVGKPPTRAAVTRIEELGIEDPANPGMPVTRDSLFWPMMEAMGVSHPPDLEPDAQAATVTLEHLIQHVAGTPLLDRRLLIEHFGPDYSSTDVASILYGSEMEPGSVCDPRPHHVWCEDPPPDPPCEAYSNEGYHLLREFLQRLTGDYEQFLEDEVVRAGSRGFDPFVISQEALDLRHPREPWYRTWGACSGDLSEGLHTGFSVSATAPAYAAFMRDWRLFWGEPIDEVIGCYSRWWTKGGYTGGSHTRSSQKIRLDSHLGVVILTNESGMGDFDVWSEILDLALEIDDDDAWGCAADFNGDAEVDTRDFVAFLNAWTAGDAAADIDGNGLVDTRDVIAYLGLWTAGCG